MHGSKLKENHMLSNLSYKNVIKLAQQQNAALNALALAPFELAAALLFLAC